MREKKIRIYFNAEERRLLLQSLVELKNQVIQEGGYGDCIDEIIRTDIFHRSAAYSLQKKRKKGQQSKIFHLII